MPGESGAPTIQNEINQKTHTHTKNPNNTKIRTKVVAGAKLGDNAGVARGVCLRHCRGARLDDVKLGADVALCPSRICVGGDEKNKTSKHKQKHIPV